MPSDTAGREHFAMPELYDEACTRCAGCMEQTVLHKLRWCKLYDVDITAVAYCHKNKENDNVSNTYLHT